MDLKQRNKGFMNYSIIGSGNVGTALARLSSRKNIKVGIANSPGSKTLASWTKELSPSVVPQSVQDAYEAEMIFLGVPFPSDKDVAKQFRIGTARSLSTLRMPWMLIRKSCAAPLFSEVASQTFVGARRFASNTISLISFIARIWKENFYL
jgi:8-hydroxy-5-deazaflavin:NADPH oxidoreductase